MIDSITFITPYVYVGGQTAARALSNIYLNGIRCIINVARELPHVQYPSHIESIKINIDDVSTYHIEKYFDKIADKIHQNETIVKRKTLVHCQAGMSRSVTCVIAYLMKYKQMSLIQAYNYVKYKRQIAKPNYGFWKQLQTYERKLIKQNNQTITNKFQAIIYTIKTKLNKIFYVQDDHRYRIQKIVYIPARSMFYPFIKY
ncbi:unnamed protein product [Didymodactylos carnosus]|uniref:protein-serine/threonine phosphatase n=1 Tax=Didymodactylos carnosus TaxID=1234261 RepID=A0A813UH42_9BILA|nr:unnamed protein product [Didymodactylos carnosus]CAF3613308.1 unnamed protein product [Didymodactylos carnosus]